jgi:hypothetical protein
MEAGNTPFREALMVLNRRRLLTALGVAALAWSGLAAAQAYRPGEFLSLELSKAVLSPTPLGPATSFTPGPLGVTVDRGTSPAQADAGSVADPKIVAAETVHTESKPVASAAARRSIAARTRVGRVAVERPTSRKPHTLVALHGRNPVEAQAQDIGSRTRIQVWPCKRGGICNWKR